MCLRIFAVTLSLLIVGCTSIPLSSISKLSSLDPATADFIQMEVAVRVEEDYLLYKDGVLMILKLETRAEGVEAESVLNRLVLQPIEDGLTAKLQSQVKRGFYIKRFRVDPADKEIAESFRQEILNRQQAYPKQNLFSVSAGVNGCFREGSNPFRDKRYSVYLRRSPAEDYFTLFRETKIPYKSSDTEGPDDAGSEYCKDEDRDRLF